MSLDESPMVPESGLAKEKRRRKLLEAVPDLRTVKDELARVGALATILGNRFDGLSLISRDITNTVTQLIVDIEGAIKAINEESHSDKINGDNPHG